MKAIYDFEIRLRFSKEILIVMAGDKWEAVRIAKACGRGEIKSVKKSRYLGTAPS